MELFFSSNDEQFNYLEEIYADLLAFTFAHLNLKASPIISVSLVDESFIQEINRTYRQIDKVTDVISFAFLDNNPNRNSLLNKEGPIDLGEIYICLERAKEQAKEYGHTLERELDFLFIHGLLHLLGYDHMCEEDEKKMFSLQEEILTNKGVTR